MSCVDHCALGLLLVPGNAGRCGSRYAGRAQVIRAQAREHVRAKPRSSPVSDSRWSPGGQVYEDSAPWRASRHRQRRCGGRHARDRRDGFASWSVSVLVGWHTVAFVFLGWVWGTIMRKDAKATKDHALLRPVSGARLALPSRCAWRNRTDRPPPRARRGERSARIARGGRVRERPAASRLRRRTPRAGR